MRILVGTLYSGENEIDECVESIWKQSYTNWKHFIIRNLSNKEAHDTLYRRFMENAKEFDLFMKVDADMVIENKFLFAEIITKFEINKELQRLTIAVHDFFSNRLILGLHTYRNTVRWKVNKEDLFVDRLDNKEYVGLDDYTDLAPAAMHCKNPSMFQAFHYGAHRGLKIIERGRRREERNYLSMRGRWAHLQAVYRHYNKYGDKRVGMACLAAELAFKNAFLPQYLDYSNSYMLRVYEKYNMLSDVELHNEIRRLHYSTFGFLPSRIRRDLLWYLSTPRKLSLSAILLLGKRLLASYE